MSFREQGHRFDWGVLRWCQLTLNAPDGCYDAENIALDEFGHAEVLNHHVNFADEHDYLDAVVQTYSHTKPNVGWSAHAFGRCDVATCSGNTTCRSSRRSTRPASTSRRP